MNINNSSFNLTHYVGQEFLAGRIENAQIAAKYFEALKESETNPKPLMSTEEFFPMKTDAEVTADAFLKETDRVVPSEIKNDSN